MANVCGALIVCTILTVCWGQNSFDSILSDVTACEEGCTKSYSPHTNPNPSNHVACARGCRLYSISNIIVENHDHGNAVDGSDAHPVRNTCYNACVEAYNETSPSTASCKVGCDSQEIKVAESKKKDDDEGPSIHLLSPLRQVHSVYSSFVGAVHIVRSSLVTYFMSDDSSIVVVESEPQVFMEVLSEAEVENPLQEALQQSRQMPMMEPVEDPSVVHCVSRRLGVPPYLLVASVLVLVLFTVYVIFAVCTTATPPKAKAYASGLSVQADPIHMPVKLVRPEDLTRLSLTEEEDLQAPPLPTKVKLPDSVI
ncbi:transmembrane protein 59-like [Homarus americanus]|uniref:Transmembrane protein 59-like 1 n=1 Tax=Homarus americanus TaxID=6706 RepID=A0A8J5N4E6_HOMAM|nr:transmembrane protein 59-like [Homarus americanus]KAG7173212.1 Transmembrane protein 59-like 1 [Homarus americanus]